MSEIARYAVAWAEWRRALLDLIAATDRLAAAAPDARARLRRDHKTEERVELNNSDVVLMVGLHKNGDLFVREAA